MKKHFIYAVATIIFLGILSSAVATEREDLIRVATQEIESLAMPYTHFHQVEYEPEDQLLMVKFKTGSGFKWNLNQFYLLWWDMQFIALDAFEKREIPVNAVAVITNFEDGSGPFLMMTESAYIRKYANATYGMTRWLDLTDSYTWDEQEEKWSLVPK